MDPDGPELTSIGAGPGYCKADSGTVQVPPRVSVCVVTWMHRDLIAQCLDSIVMQRTSFPYEVIVSDDASTDGTGEICRQYAERFPGLVRALVQPRRLGMMENTRAVTADVRGEFIAWCDGDDYWTDPEKLQLQAEALDAHPQCDLCSHGASVIEHDGRPTGRAQPAFGDRIIGADELLRRDGGLICTSSLLSRAYLMAQAPEWFFRMPMGDYFGQAIAAFRGGAVHLGRVMCAYRRDSLSVRSIAGNSPEAQRKYHRLRMEGLLGLDALSCGAHRRRIAIETLRHSRKSIRRTATALSMVDTAGVIATGLSTLAELGCRGVRACFGRCPPPGT